jgi:hypothetical protein
MRETLRSLYRRNEVFWLGLAAVVLGLLVPNAVGAGGINATRLFIVTGGGLLVTSVFVGSYRLLTGA